MAAGSTSTSENNPKTNARRLAAAKAQAPGGGIATSAPPPFKTPAPANSTPYLDDNANTWQGALQGVGLVGGAIAGAATGGPLAAVGASRLGWSLGGAAGAGIDGADANYKQPATWQLGADGKLHPPLDPNDPAVIAADAAAAAKNKLYKPMATGSAPTTGTTSAPLTSTAPPGTSTTTADLAKAYYDQKSRPAPQVAPATVGPAAQATAATATAPTVGPAAQATAATAGKTAVDQTAANGTRTQQEDAISNLVAAANGTKPSAAELQLKQSTDRAVANQLALASAVQGRSVGGALKQASDQAGAITAQGDSDAAILRAKEQADARAALSSTLQGVRGQDIDVASTDATLGNAVNITNANNATSVGQTNAAGQNTLTGKQADVSSAAGITNANNATNVSQTNTSETNKLISQQADIGMKTALADADNQLKARGLDDDQRAKILQDMVTSKGQDLNYSGDVMRNNTALTLGAGDLDIRNRALALSGDQQNWNKYKDVISGLGAGSTALGTSDFLKNYLSGSSSSGTPNNPDLSTSDYYPGDSGGGIDPDTGLPFDDTGIADGGT